MKDIEGIDKVLKVLEPHWADIEADFETNNKRFLALAATDHDAIGRILRAHLVIENFMTTFLETHFGFEDVSSIKLSFFQKATMIPPKASSAAFVRPGILQLNSVRNKYGHRLDHKINDQEISAIYEVLRIARAGVQFDGPLAAIEAFAPIACAFLSIPPKHLQDLFAKAFSEVRTFVPE